MGDGMNPEHLPIQRWKKIFTRYPASELLPNESGEYVTYAEHVAALRAYEQQVHKIAYAQGLGAGSDEHRQHEMGWIAGYDAALDDAREALADINGKWIFGPRIYKHKAVSAIDALRKAER